MNHFFAQSPFATKAVVHESAAVPVDEDVPLEEAALLGCGAATGLGGVLNTAGVTAGESVAVFGCGGVGMSAVMAANAVDADPIIAVDVVPDKLDGMKGGEGIRTVLSLEWRRSPSASSQGGSRELRTR